MVFDFCADTDFSFCGYNADTFIHYDLMSSGIILNLIFRYIITTIIHYSYEYCIDTWVGTVVLRHFSDYLLFEMGHVSVMSVSCLES